MTLDAPKIDATFEELLEPSTPIIVSEPNFVALPFVDRVQTPEAAIHCAQRAADDATYIRLLRHENRDRAPAQVLYAVGEILQASLSTEGLSWVCETSC